MKRLFAVLLALLTLLALAVTAFAAEGNVTYSGDAGEFIFAPGSDYSPTDLFSNFKDVMPGDTLSQRIVVKNDASRDVKIKIYMRSLGAHQDSAAFLSQLRLRVEQVADTVMFDAAADQTAQLTDWTCLGTLYSGGTVELDVLLEVPTSLDNTGMDMVGYLDWEFMIEELPVDPTDPEPPKTGDETNLTLYLLLLAASCAVLVWVLLMLRRKKK